MKTHTGRCNEWAAQSILETCVKGGVRQAVLCPGSRSTTLAVHAMHMPELEVLTHFDERGAAFFALGLAKSSERPVLWITTSGTAVANGLPAVVEAGLSRVPLILLTADRPPELWNCGANQSIDQVGLFGSHVRFETNLLCADAQPGQGWFAAQAAQALESATEPGREGAVHINLMFREPFLDEKGLGLPVRLGELDASPPVRRGLDLDQRDLCAFAEELTKAREGMLLIGALRTRAEVEAARAFAQALDWPCVADPASGLRFSEDVPNLLARMDLLLLNERLHWLQPDWVLWIGGPLVSRRLLEWTAREGARSRLLRLGSSAVREDPLHRATIYQQADLTLALPRLAEALGEPALDPEWVSRWKRAEARVEKETAQDGLPFEQGLSEHTVARMITDVRAHSFQLFLGNSLPIRETDQFGLQNRMIEAVGANRGASGIDGLIATAAGMARAQALPMLAVIGDLSALHDINSLALLRDFPVPLALVLINNDGGGIFHFLPVREQTSVFEPGFVMPQRVHFRGFAESFGLTYVSPDSPAALKQVLDQALSEPGCTVIEVVTRRSQTCQDHQDLAAAIRSMNL